MFRIAVLLLTIISQLSVAFANEQAANSGNSTQPPFDFEKERAYVLQVADTKNTTDIQVLNQDQASADAKDFFSFYKKFHAKSEEINNLSHRYAALHLGLDRALYKSEEEKKSWMEEKNKILNEINAWQASLEYKEYVQKAYDLTRFIRARPELSQYFAIWAEVLYETEKLTGTTEEDLPLLERMTELNSEIDEIANRSPFNTGLGEVSRERDRIREKFYKGELSFRQASDKLKSLVPRGYDAHGQFVAQTARAQLKELAILRTRLAKRKGFANWAQYQLATEKFNHNPGYVTAEERIHFLRRYLDNTQAQMEEFYKTKVYAQPGAVWGRLNAAQASLFASPVGLKMKPFFDKNKIEEIVKTALIESGFSIEAVNGVNMDNYPREGKYSHAYMYPAVTPQAKVLTFDATNMQMTLDIGDTNWTKPAIFIVQNLRDDGLAAYETAFHEMGHAMDYTHRRSQEVTAPAYGYVETHSIFMERFMEDPEFLRAVGRDSSGAEISEEVLQEYIQESVIGRFMNFRQGNAFNSLYDLEVWNYAYDETTPDLVDRMLKLSREMTDKYSPFKEEVIEGVDQAYGMFATDHFYSGSVRYIGYLYADIASDMVFRSTAARLKSQTGRGSLYRQPNLGPLLNKQFYQLGAMTQFPQVIEEATDMPFSAEAQAVRFNSAVTEYLEQSTPDEITSVRDTDCARLLN